MAGLCLRGVAPRTSSAAGRDIEIIEDSAGRGAWVGADLNWVGYDRLTPLDAARRSGAEQLADWLASRGAKSTGELA